MFVLKDPIQHRSVGAIEWFDSPESEPYRRLVVMTAGVAAFIGLVFRSTIGIAPTYMSAGFLVGRLVKEELQQFPDVQLLIMSCCRIRKEYSRLQLVMLVVIIIVSPIFLWQGCVVGCIFGTLSGITYAPPTRNLLT